MALFFGRKRTARAPAEAPVRRGPSGRRCYAIGDVHGRLDLLDRLLELIQADIRDRPSGDHVLVFLGDLIDRGPDSRGVVRRARQGIPEARTLGLKGNHEEMFARGLSGEAGLLPRWLSYGGYECAQSYGVEIGALFGRSADEVEAILAQAVPQGDVRFLDGLPDSARFGDYLLVHAGVRPGIPLDRQHPEDLRWIREGFLDVDEDPGAMIIHGHSITPDVEERPHRICIDTGAYATGVLTAIWIEDDQRGFLQATLPR